MSFNEIYGMLKSENVDKVCFVETGAFFLTIGSDVECLEGILGFNRTCFSEGICKTGFPNNSLAKYMKIMHDMGIPYVIYGYVLDEESKFKIEIEYNGKKYTKLAEMDGDIVIKKRIEKLYSTYKVDCNRCEYKKTKLIKEMKACEFGNIFSVIVSEKYLGAYLLGYVYYNLCVDDIVCIYGSMISSSNQYIILCEEVYTIKSLD